MDSPSRGCGRGPGGHGSHGGGRGEGIMAPEMGSMVRTSGSGQVRGRGRGAGGGMEGGRGGRPTTHGHAHGAFMAARSGRGGRGQASQYPGPYNDPDSICRREMESLGYGGGHEMGGGHDFGMGGDRGMPNYYSDDDW